LHGKGEVAGFVKEAEVQEDVHVRQCRLHVGRLGCEDADGLLCVFTAQNVVDLDNLGVEVLAVHGKVDVVGKFFIFGSFLVPLFLLLFLGWGLLFPMLMLLCFVGGSRWLVFPHLWSVSLLGGGRVSPKIYFSRSRDWKYRV
jgi:hypothetical protein